MKFHPVRLLAVLLCLAGPAPMPAWDYAGHRAVNLVALRSLPAEFPAFVKTAKARERIAFLAGEPDRWRNTPDHTLKHCNEPDHFLDLEYLANFGLTPDTVSPFRYEFISQLAAARAKQPDLEPQPQPDKDKAFTRHYFGTLPWAINEHYGKLKSAFSYLQTYEQHGGTPDEIRNARENVLYLMGVMGHYVGDLTQPLHTTKHFNGWNGDNPKKYTTWTRFHAWIDGDYLKRVGFSVEELFPKVRPARPLAGANADGTGIFRPVMAALVEQNKLVEPLYILNQRRQLDAENPGADAGKAFLLEQLLKGGQLLGNIWLTAWQTAPPDTYLRSSLVKRQLGNEASDKNSSPKSSPGKK
jgi:hypothetical protein